MKGKWAIGTVLVIAMLVTLPCNAQDMAAEGRESCGIEGTWYGVNSAGFNFVFRMEKNAAGGFSIVADGFNDAISYCLEYTAWHGELAKIGPRSYRFRQIELCDPNPAVLPDPYPDGGLWLWASEGVLTLSGCDLIEADLPDNGAYAWGSGKVPFQDDFDLVFPFPITGTFHRMPAP